MVNRWARALTMLFVLTMVAWAPADIRDTIRDRAAAHDVSGEAMVALATCETQLDPNQVGDQGELGVFQLHPRGELIHFYELGYTDPRNTWESADYVALVISTRGAGPWVICGHRAGLL